MSVASDPLRTPRRAVALNLDLAHGRHGASARLELHDRGGMRVALLSLRGWLDDIAVRRLEEALEDISERGASQLLLDCSQLRHIDYRMVPSLVTALERFETHAGGFVLCGLSQYLRDLFRLAGCDRTLRFWPSAEELLEGNGGGSRESAS
ncbi:MAG: STAS domain-containing protein [Candidatus Eisenbacteria bacterium]